MRHHNFLLVCSYPQSHINPMLRLGHRLMSLGARVTFSSTIAAHRRMFPDQGGDAGVPFDDPLDPLLTYHPYSDGHDDGRPEGLCPAEFFNRAATVGSETVYTIATSAATQGRPAPITCVIYTLLVPWAAGVARRAGVPSVFFWIQPAALFAVYYHYFHDYRAAIDEIVSRRAGPDVVSGDGREDERSSSVELPRLPRLHYRDLPSLITDSTSSGGGSTDDIRPTEKWSKFLIRSFEDSFRVLDEEHDSAADGKKTLPKVLVNTFYELEVEAIRSLSNVAELIPVGPMLPPDQEAVDAKGSATTGLGKQKQDSDGHLEWLSRWPDRSVVYMSFGSLSQLNKIRLQELAKGIAGCGRPFLWILRGDSAVELKESVLQDAGEKGRVASWCDQVQVLQHPSVGCFITHCGWNSVSEGLAGGVPMVAMPFWTDQPTNARLMTGTWKLGVATQADGEGVVRARELQRCIKLVMGDGQVRETIRRAANNWMEKARQAIKDGGPSHSNLKLFVDGLGRP